MRFSSSLGVCAVHTLLLCVTTQHDVTMVACGGGNLMVARKQPGPITGTLLDSLRSLTQFEYISTHTEFRKFLMSFVILSEILAFDTIQLG